MRRASDGRVGIEIVDDVPFDDESGIVRITRGTSWFTGFSLTEGRTTTSFLCVPALASAL